MKTKRLKIMAVWTVVLGLVVVGATVLVCKDDLYELWLDSLCKALEVMDPDWSMGLEAAWRARMRPGIELITSRY